MDNLQGIKTKLLQSVYETMFLEAVRPYMTLLHWTLPPGRRTP
jgi:hypothetical protein